MSDRDLADVASEQPAVGNNAGSLISRQLTSISPARELHQSATPDQTARNTVSAAMSTRPRLVAKRWNRLGLLALVACIAAISLLAFILPAPDRLPPATALGIAGLALTLLLSRAITARDRKRSFWASSRWQLHPPTWFAAVPGVLLGLSCGFVHANLAGWWLPMVAGATAAFGWLAGRRAGTHLASLRPAVAATSPSLPVGPAAVALDDDAFVAWLLSDDAVSTPDRDLLGHSPVAARMARRLIEEPSSSQCLIGPLGSGKTTIRHLVATHLAAHAKSRPAERLILVPVEIGRYQTSLAAVEGTLRELLEAMDDELDLVSVRGLPEAYGQAMTAGGGVWAALAKLQGTPVTQREQLEALDDIATAAGLRYVLWIEDLERFGGGGDLPVETAGDAEKLAPIRSLLHGLSSLRSVQVVMATTSLTAGIDVGKLARYAEHVPSMSSAVAMAWLHRVRTLMSTVETRAASSAPSHRGLEPDSWGPEWHVAVWATRPDPMPHIQIALPALVRTPRAVKFGLRRALEAWGYGERRGPLAGEIDPDDLLVGKLLAAGQPAFFGWMDENIIECRLRKGQAWEGRLDAWKGLGIRDIQAAKCVVEFLFEKGASYQGVRESGLADYWGRLQSEATSEPTDQRLLEMLWSADAADGLEALSHPEAAQRAEQFARALPGDRVEALWRGGLGRWKQERHSPSLEERADAFLPVWSLTKRLVDTAALSVGVVEQRIVDAYDELLPEHVGLALKIEQVYGAYESPTACLPDDVRARLRQELRTRFFSKVAGSPDALITSLRGHLPFVLCWLLIGLPAIRARTFVLEPSIDVERVMTLLAAAFARDPSVVGPQLAGMVVRGGDDQFGRPVSPTLDETLITNVFGGPDRLRASFPYEGEEEWSRGRREAVLVALLRPDHPHGAAKKAPCSSEATTLD